jgi:hypothetical protein
MAHHHHPTPPVEGGPYTQIDPGQKDFRLYTFRDALTVVATVLVPRREGSLHGVEYAPDREYWFDVSPTRPLRQLTVTWEDHLWSERELPRPGTRSFIMERAPTWAPLGADVLPITGADIFACSAPRLALRWRLGRDEQTQRWSGQLSWYNNTGENNVFQGLEGSLELRSDTGFDRDKPWFEVTVAPQSAG